MRIAIPNITVTPNIIKALVTGDLFSFPNHRLLGSVLHTAMLWTYFWFTMSDDMEWLQHVVVNSVGVVFVVVMMKASFGRKLPQRILDHSPITHLATVLGESLQRTPFAALLLVIPIAYLTDPVSWTLVMIIKFLAFHLPASETPLTSPSDISSSTSSEITPPPTETE